MPVREGRGRRLNMQMALNHLVAQRRRVLNACFLVLLFISSQQNNITPVSRSCRRLSRNTGCWENAWNNYSEARFKKTFRISRSTLRYMHIKWHWPISCKRNSDRRTNFPRTEASAFFICYWTAYFPAPYSFIDLEDRTGHTEVFFAPQKSIFCIL